ncbi:Lysophospholipid acyltransferase LPEAT1 [Smittium mucronatum]|nr:Lysophospholipid acyltransferase LPEAT1 [Smittium mucronatum]
MQPLRGYAALFASTHPPAALLKASVAKSLSEICTEARATNSGPVVVFPENTSSNGKALLSFLPIFSDLGNEDPKSNLFLFALKYPYKSFCPTYSIGSVFRHLVGLCCQIYNRLVVVQVADDSCPKFGIESKPGSDEPYDLDEEIRLTITAASRLRSTKLTALDKIDFVKYYNERQRIYK